MRSTRPRVRLALPLGSMALLLTLLTGLASASATVTVRDDGPVLAQDAGEVVRGFIKDAEGAGVPGVEVTVATGDGDVIDTASTDDEGAWEIPLPGPGAYTAEVDVETLPEGAALRNPDRNPLSFEITPGQQRTLLFPLGEGVGGGPTFLDRFIDATVNGFQFGLIIAMTAIGLSLIFGTTGLVNFAHSELVTIGAVIAWFLNAPADRDGIGWVAALMLAVFIAPALLIGRDRVLQRSTGWSTAVPVLLVGTAAIAAIFWVLPGGLHLIPAAVIGIVATAGIGAALERGLWRPLRRRRTGLIQMLVISIGLALLLRNAIQIWFGGGSAPFFDYTVQQSLTFGPVRLTPRDLAIIVIALASLVAVATMLQRTRIGKAMRAVADNRDLAASSGIDVQHVILVVWVLGAGLAAFGGILAGVDENVSFLLGFRLLLLMFAGVILGGLGTAYGAMVGSLVVGLVTEWSTLYFSPELKFVWPLFVLIIILLFRPQGILGEKERIG